MSTTPLSFGEYLELMLARLVEADRDEPGTFVDMFPLAEELRQNVPDDWVFEAGDALESRGLVKQLKVMGRTAPTRLTGEGRLFVEAGGGTGIINEYRRDPSNFVIVSGSGHQVAVGVEGDVTQTSTQTGVPDEVWDLLDQIASLLGADERLDDVERAQAIADVAAARNQLERPTPNKRAATAILDPLANISSIGGFVTQLGQLLS